MWKDKYMMWRRNVKEIRQRKSYSAEVIEFCRTNTGAVIDSWIMLCEKTNGRISFEQLEEVLHGYPKAPWINPEDSKEQIKAFFREIKIPFKADDTHIYFP